MVWYIHIPWLPVDINLQPDPVQFQTVEIHSPNPSDALSCPHKFPSVLSTQDLCATRWHWEQTLSQAFAAVSRKSALALLKWSWKKARPDFSGCRYAERNQWKIRGQPQSTLWLWPAAVTTAAVVCHEFPLLCFPAPHSRCGGFSAPTLLTLAKQHSQQNHPGSSPAASDR